MISVDARGRMGNQMFQLAFAHAASRRLDTSFVFGAASLEEGFDLGPWGRISTRLLRKARFHARYGAGGPEALFVDDGRDPAEVLAELRDHVAYGGFFQSERYFAGHEDEVRALFAVRAEHERAYAERYGGLGAYVCVHVRRADYLQTDGWALPASYFTDALAAGAGVGERETIVVSDDLRAAREELGHLPGLRFEANAPMVDLLLLMNAQTVVLSNSSFSWWGAYLNRRPGVRILTPEHWVGFERGIETPRGIIRPAKTEVMPAVPVELRRVGPQPFCQRVRQGPDARRTGSIRNRRVRSSPVHVGFALLTLFPGRVGGSESAVRGLLDQFAAGNGPEQVTILANRHVASAYRSFAQGAVRLHEVTSYRAGNSNLTRTMAVASARAAPRLAARDVPSGLDLIHHPVTVPVPRPRKVPVVTTLHDVQHHELPELFSRSELVWRRWAYDGAARRANLVITPSAHARERLIELIGLDPERVETVPWGIDHTRYDPHPSEADERLAQRLPRRFVVYPANMWRHKNHTRLVEALARVKQDDLHLVLIGQTYGRDAELRQHVARLGIEHRVRHLGYLPVADVPALYRAAEAMIFPSLYEGFGSPPLEAMACGCPVACSSRASLGEVVGDAGLHLEPESVESIAMAVERIVADEDLRTSLRERGLARAAAFTWESAAERHVELYDRAVAS